MSEKEFNLLDEKWIRVMHSSGETEEVSLIEVFQRAPEFKGLAGELPTQDIAVLRLLLAILHAVIGRYDLEGNYAPVFSSKDMSATPQDALTRWKSLWDNKSFPMGKIEEYLRHYEERFYLFHPETPFYQVAEIVDATEYSAAKLNGELSESGNKIRLFSQRSNKKKKELFYNEAARWLLYVNAFDDTSSKPRRQGLPSPGAGWLGKLGLVIAVGDSLFETMMLNLVLLKDGEDALWSSGKPVWEISEVKKDERTEIVIPANPAALLTLQSRRLRLIKNENQNCVIEYLLLGGDFFPKENSLMEQMTVWRNNAKKESDPTEYVPKRHDPSKQLWRELSSLIVQKKGNRPPGVVRWIERLAGEDILNRKNICFLTVSVKYGDKDFFVDDVFSDTISLNAGILKEKDEEWVFRIVEEINMTELLVAQLGYLAQNPEKAAGHENGDRSKTAAKEQAYFRLDNPFRTWLESIEPDKDGDRKQEVFDQWWSISQKIVRGLGRDIIAEAGQQAFIGRKTKEKNKEYSYSAPEAYNMFLFKTSSRDALKGGKS